MRHSQDKSMQFEMLLTIIFIMSLISLLLAVILSGVRDPSAAQISLIETCSSTWKLGFGAFLGLIGGRSFVTHTNSSAPPANPPMT